MHGLLFLFSTRQSRPAADCDDRRRPHLDLPRGLPRRLTVCDGPPWAGARAVDGDVVPISTRAVDFFAGP
jgi:hypothetical protein